MCRCTTSQEEATGSYPYGKVLIDAMGNIYGTASGGGSCCGVVFEITP